MTLCVQKVSGETWMTKFWKKNKNFGHFAKMRSSHSFIVLGMLMLLSIVNAQVGFIEQKLNLRIASIFIQFRVELAKNERKT